MGFIFEHKKTKARVSFISNDDYNKVFSIGFRTPPKDSTGVAHIIEHTVLCGSKKYPVKDPFVELVKGSLNTFLNAMTYPDKTVYPVASTNDQDFFNLMDVYMDAVLHPNIYKYKEIFEQEGWHYELESAEDELTINGVVYNEMKGAFSSPDDVLNRQVLNSLFPDNTYAFESGGDPKDIPKLTYEEFIAFHQKYYHPSNSFIYIYGDVDIDEVLEYLDHDYLRHYDYLEVDSEIKLQAPFDAPREYSFDYSISNDQEEEDATYLSCNYAVGDALDAKLYQAFDVLEYALLTSPGAPVHQALIDAGIGEDIYGGYDTCSRQPMFSVVARGANASDKERFIEIIDNTLRELVEKGLDKKALLAAINVNQFRTREADFGNYPKGLMYGLQMLDSWLYDKNKPFLHLHGIEVLDDLKKRIDKGYFENLIEKYLLNNNHRSVVILNPKKGLTTLEDKALKDKLASIKASMSKDEIDRIVERTAYLKEYQETPSSKKDLAKIPMLSRGDLGKDARKIDLEIHELEGTTVLHHKLNTNGIHYLNLVFDISEIGLEDLCYAGLIERFLGLVNTENYCYTDLANEINLCCGGLGTSVNMYSVHESHEEYKMTFEVRCKFLFEDVKKASALISEMMFKSDFSDEKRLHELILQDKSRMDSILNSAGHQLAITQAKARYSKKAVIADHSAGVAYYRFITELADNFEDKKSYIIEKLTTLCRIIFAKDRLIVSSTGKNEALKQAKELTRYFKPLLSEGLSFEATGPIELYEGKAAFKDAAQIQYVCMAGDFTKAGFKYTGVLKILKTILEYDYLWIKVRVQGGAYGCMAGSTREGDMHFVSYRDPNLTKTIEVYEGIADYLEAFDADERDMTKYVIGTISGMDIPRTPSQRGLRGLSAYLTGVTLEVLQKEREQVLNATVKDIRALSDMVKAVVAQNNLCVVGNESAIDENAKLFDTIESLF
ncbi:MAG: insulinase family protein [Pseudobutyrivibrio sp.]|nr:insulinase family protein [Pseudobutyrivibrio sp.]